MPFLLVVMIAVVLAGLAVWVLSQLPLDPAIMKIGRVVIIVALVIWLLASFFGGLPAGWAPRYR